MGRRAKYITEKERRKAESNRLSIRRLNTKLYEKQKEQQREHYRTRYNQHRLIQGNDVDREEAIDISETMKNCEVSENFSDDERNDVIDYDVR